MARVVEVNFFFFFAFRVTISLIILIPRCTHTRTIVSRRERGAIQGDAENKVRIKYAQCKIGTDFFFVIARSITFFIDFCAVFLSRVTKFNVRVGVRGLSAITVFYDRR